MATWRREAARLVLLDPDDRVLLLRASDPTRPHQGGWWELPGGGIEPGELSSAAASRELYEETGIGGVTIGPCVWTQHVAFSFAGYDFDQNEWVHIARCDGGEYRPAALEAIEALAFEGARWWPVEDLGPLVDTGERIIPPWLPDQLAAVLAAGVPARPIDLGHQ
jgi:8-oxo-dGTP pyrophosphatase MutT (NUDIX family)